MTNFWVRRPPGGVGVKRSGGGSKSSCPPSKVCFPWVSREGTWDVPGILPGCPGPLGVFKKFVQKRFVHILRSPNGDTPSLLACELEVQHPHGATSPCKRGIPAILARCHRKARRKGCNTPCAIPFFAKSLTPHAPWNPPSPQQLR